jgi:hypothetical protein
MNGQLLFFGCQVPKVLGEKMPIANPFFLTKKNIFARTCQLLGTILIFQRGKKKQDRVSFHYLPTYTLFDL